MKRRIVGKRAVQEALTAGGLLHVIYVSTKERDSLTQIVALAQRAGLIVETASPAELDQLAKGMPHQGIVAIAGSYSYLPLESLIPNDGRGGQRLVALDEITDPQNLGAIVRSAVAFGFDGLILPRHRAASVTAAVVRASAGGTEHAKIARVSNLSKAFAYLREHHDYEVIGLAADAEIPLQALAPSDRNRVLVVGSEGKGLRRLVKEHCDMVVRIEMKGPLGSLNASVAAAIAMYTLSAATINDSI